MKITYSQTFTFINKSNKGRYLAMMTIVEKWLKDYIRYCTNDNYVLYKFYEVDEDRSSGLPDIWDTLLDMYDEAEEQYDDERFAFATEIAAGRHPSHCKVDVAKKYYEEVKEMLDYVEKSSARYFVLKRPTFKLFGPKIHEVTKQKFPIYKAVLDGEYMRLDETSEYAHIWTFGPDGCPMSYNAFNDFSDFTVTVDPYYLEFDSKYVFYLKNKDELEELKLHYYTCKDCGKIFSLTNSHMKYFKDHSLEIPKRCDHCRNIKKIAKMCRAHKHELMYPLDYVSRINTDKMYEIHEVNPFEIYFKYDTF